MEADFWLKRWELAETGFHQDEINPHLENYWQSLSAPPGCEVFVPLCGKSRDMLWLRHQGHPVVGVELSPIAAAAFFDENRLAFITEATDCFTQYRADGLRILCGDFFDLRRADLQQVGAVYDRASLVALPPAMRQRYADHLLEILPPGSRMLLITFEYDQSKMSGPPFSVTPQEVGALYGARATVEQLARLDVLAQNPRFRQRGLDAIHENVFLITCRG